MYIFQRNTAELKVLYVCIENVFIDFVCTIRKMATVLYKKRGNFMPFRESDKIRYLWLTDLFTANQRLFYWRTALRLVLPTKSDWLTLSPNQFYHSASRYSWSWTFDWLIYFKSRVYYLRVKLPSRVFIRL